MIIDFTDMLYLPFEWHQQPARKYGFLFVDECQDLSKSQFAVVAKYGKRDGRILAVGDPQQSIYGFTGADINSFQRVKELH
jgi:DNA helicase-2/ATP-dependent DNA helicase PcrA